MPDHARPPEGGPGTSPAPPDDPEFDDELLDSGQEEVFSRTEVERGAIEHASGAGKRERTP